MIQGSRALWESSVVVVEVQGGLGVQLELMGERARADQRMELAGVKPKEFLQSQLARHETLAVLAGGLVVVEPGLVPAESRSGPGEASHAR